MKFPSKDHVVFPNFANKKPETERNDFSKFIHTSNNGF